MMGEAMAWLADGANWTGDAGIWMRLAQHLGVTVAVVAVAALVAVPVGIAIGHAHRGRAVVTLSSGAARALPSGLRVLAQADATDADSYVVTKAFADEHGAASIADLAGIEGLVLAGNSELESRPYGPEGLKRVYGVDIAQFKPVEDSGGPLTVKALSDGDADIVDLYSSTPALASGDLVVLADPKGLFLASHVVPVVSDRVDAGAAAAIDAVDAALTADELIAMNGESVNGQRSAAVIAADFLTRNGLA